MLNHKISICSKFDTYFLIFEQCFEDQSGVKLKKSNNELKKILFIMFVLILYYIVFVCVYFWTTKQKIIKTTYDIRGKKTSFIHFLCISESSNDELPEKKETKRKSIYSTLSFYCFAIIIMLLITKKKMWKRKSSAKTLRKINNDSS